MTLPPGVELTPREKRLFELRLRMNNARKKNHKEVVGEAKSRMDLAQGKKRSKDKEERAERGKEAVKKEDAHMHISQADAEEGEERAGKKKKKQAGFGLEAF